MNFSNSQNRFLSWVFILLLSFVCITKVIHTHGDYFEQEINHAHCDEDSNVAHTDEDCNICAFSLTACEPMAIPTEEIHSIEIKHLIPSLEQVQLQSERKLSLRAPPAA